LVLPELYTPARR